MFVGHSIYVFCEEVFLCSFLEPFIFFDFITKAVILCGNAARRVTRRFEKKILPIFLKVSMAKKAKISTTMLNLKALNIHIKPLLKLKIPTTNHVLKLLI